MFDDKDVRDMLLEGRTLFPVVYLTGTFAVRLAEAQICSQGINLLRKDLSEIFFLKKKLLF